MAGPQNYKTPRSFIDAVERRFGPIVFDLAAEDGHVCRNFYAEKDDSLAQDWVALYKRIGVSRVRRAGKVETRPNWFWLNPPFSGGPTPEGEKKRTLENWTRKCWEASREGVRILYLVPASVDSQWWENWVRGRGRDEAIAPRIEFVGKDEPFMKPLSLIVFEPGVSGASGGRWRWK